MNRHWSVDTQLNGNGMMEDSEIPRDIRSIKSVIGMRGSFWFSDESMAHYKSEIERVINVDHEKRQTTFFTVEGKGMVYQVFRAMVISWDWERTHRGHDGTYGLATIEEFSGDHAWEDAQIAAAQYARS
jgi:hypothetical protein